MRKYLIGQILDLISSMKEMHVDIQKMIEAEDLNSVQNYISICYDSAVQIDSVLEGSEEKCVNAISAIEKYAEVLNTTIKDLSSPDETKKVYYLMKEKLSVVEHFVITEIKVKYQILFLPYKASMWDSLESIWLTAKEDANCECYVMPVPYYDFKQNGEISKMRLEADQMPSYVPITHFNEYDITQQKPDIIYFHNPYDKYNKVTSVDPKYYSSELKKHTEMLVYVPYFVGDTTIEEHFCQLPGVYNADYVIVQSEQIKEIYAKYIRKDRILALGSPKFDKVISCMENKPEIPREWQEIMKDKKVVLLNTHLTMVPQYREKAIQKLQYIFDNFKNRDDAVLLWRPHPLSVETTQAMSLDLIDQYNKLVTYYKENKIGIYDDLADFHRSMAISDAYYGDMSSLALLYGITGKPVMIQDINITDRSNAPCILTSLLDENILWFLNVTNGGLYKFDFISSKTEFVEKSHNGENFYTSLVKWKDELFFTPYSGDTISAFDMKLNRVKHYPLDNFDILKENQEKYYSSILYDNKIFLISIKNPTIVCFNVEERTVDFAIDLSKEIDQYVSNKNDFYFSPYWDIIGETLIIASTNSNVVLELNMEKCEYIIRRVGSIEITYQSICFDGEYYWLCTRGSKGKIIRWNKNTDETIIFEDYPKDFISTSAYDFHSIMYINNYIWCIPYNSNKIIKINIKSLELQTIYLDYEPIDYDSNKQQFLFVFKKDNLIIAQRFADKKIIIYDTLKNKVKEFISEISDSEFITYCSKVKESYLSIVIQENLNFNINSYIAKVKKFNNIEQSYIFTSISNNIDGTCGKKVHENIMEKYKKQEIEI